MLPVLDSIVVVNPDRGDLTGDTSGDEGHVSVHVRVVSRNRVENS